MFFKWSVMLLTLPLFCFSQVFGFVQNLIGCEEQARLFKDEVSTV